MGLDNVTQFPNEQSFPLLERRSRRNNDSSFNEKFAKSSVGFPRNVVQAKWDNESSFATGFPQNVPFNNVPL